MENAQKFYDWALTPEAQALGAQSHSYQTPSNKNTPLPALGVDFSKIKLIDYDFEKYGTPAVRNDASRRAGPTRSRTSRNSARRR